MSHIVLTQIKNNVKTPILVNSNDISYSNPADDCDTDTYINLVNGVSIRVKEDALMIHNLIKEMIHYGYQ